RREPVLVGGVVHVPPGRPSLGACGARAGIDRYRTHPGEIDHDAAVVRSEAGNAVRPTAHGEVDAHLPGGVHPGLHVGDVLGPNHHRRPTVDHRVVDAPCLLIALVLRRDDCAAHLFAELLDPGGTHRSPLPPRIGVRAAPGWAPADPRTLCPALTATQRAA